MKTKIINGLIILTLTLFITGCANGASVYNYSKKNKTLYLGKNIENIVTINLTNPIIKYHNTFACNVNSYTLSDNNKEYGKLFVEYIDLSRNCEWKGLPSGFFESNVKNELKLTSFTAVESFDISSYSFKTFKVNNDFYLSIIYLYGGSSDRFILDYSGKLYTKLLKTFKPDYQNNIHFQKRFIGNYDDSLVKKNIINHYFEREFIMDSRIGINISL